jgi:hypothetical protein
MKKAYKTLTSYEFNVLNRVIYKTGNDCWAFLKQDRRGVDYFWDMEERRRMCLKSGLEVIADALSFQEGLDYCRLKWHERVTLRNLFAKCEIELDPSVDWRLPKFHGMSLAEFKELLKESKGNWYRKDGDDYCVDDVIYQFDKYDTCFSIVLCGKHDGKTWIANRLRKYSSIYKED